MFEAGGSVLEESILKVSPILTSLVMNVIGLSRDYLFVLTIKQKRVISEDSAVLTSSLESKSIVYNVRNDKNTGLVTEFEEQFQTQQFIASGVDFDQLLKSCLSLCIQAKLQYLARRLTVSLSSANADKVGVNAVYST